MDDLLEKYPDLTLAIDVDSISVDTLCLMEDFATGQNRSIRAMRNALKGLVNYPDEKIGQMPFGDMMKLFKLAMDTITGNAVPKASAPDSGPGPAT